MAFRVRESVDATNAASFPIPIPGRSDGAVRITAGGAQDVRFKFGTDNTVTAGINDCLIKSGQSLVVVIPAEMTHLAVLSASSLVNVAFGNEL